MNLIPALPLRSSKLIHDADFNPSPYGLVGNLTGKIIVNGCTWSNGGDSGSADLQDLGLVSIIPASSVTSNGTTPQNSYLYITYPYLGVFDFQPKPASPALTFTVVLSGTTQGEAIGGKLNVYGATGSLLRSYSKFNDLGTFTFSVDLTGAYRLDLKAQGYTGTGNNVTVTARVNSLYVRLPYSESFVDEV